MRLLRNGRCCAKRGGGSSENEKSRHHTIRHFRFRVRSPNNWTQGLGERCAPRSQQRQSCATHVSTGRWTDRHDGLSSRSVIIRSLNLVDESWGRRAKRSQSVTVKQVLHDSTNVRELEKFIKTDLEWLPRAGAQWAGISVGKVSSTDSGGGSAAAGTY